MQPSYSILPILFLCLFLKALIAYETLSIEEIKLVLDGRELEIPSERARKKQDKGHGPKRSKGLSRLIGAATSSSNDSDSPAINATITAPPPE